MLRAVVDTNVWVSALLNPKGKPAELLDAFKRGRFRPVLSQPMMEELLDVLSRPRLVLKYRLQPVEVAQYISLIVAQSDIAVPVGSLRICRDPRDDIVLETALKGRASHLVSRDDDLKSDEELLLEMERRGVRVLSVNKFLLELTQK